MNGIEKITARITAEAQAIADADLAAGEKQAASIREKYEQKAQAEFETLLNQGVADNEQSIQRQNRTDTLEAKKSVLGMKQELIAAAYALAKEKLLNMPEDQYVAFLAKQAADAALTGTEEVILNGKDRAAVGEKVVAAANALLGGKGQLVLSEAVRGFAGGLVLKQGDIEVNCTIDTLVELSHSDLDAQVAGILFN